MVEEACKLPIEPRDGQWALAGTPVGTPYECQLPGSPYFNIGLQTPKAVSIQSWSVFLYQMYEDSYTTRYASTKPMIRKIGGWWVHLAR